MIGRLQESSITRCAVLLVAKFAQSLLDRTNADYRCSFNKSVEQFEQKLHLVSSQADATPNEVQYRLKGFLEVRHFKLMVLHFGDIPYGYSSHF